ncbi:MAG TPA: primosomal protein N', partial [Longimicrobiales bacterium]|nr:primosomal protein N' [Longimicrobiales bacterium]
MLLEVALPVPVPHTFTYRTSDSIGPGTRVQVRFGGRRLTGWVVGPTPEQREPKNLRDIESVLESQPSVPADVLELCRWIADYYLAPIGLVLRTALPVVLSDGVRLEQPLKKRKVVRIIRELPSLQERDELFGRAVRQRALYELLETLGSAQDLSQLISHQGFSSALVRALEERGLVAVTEQAVERDPFAAMPSPDPPALIPTPAQQAALAELAGAVARPDSSAPATAPFLLHGVTGSGKTLVYIELLRAVLNRGLGAIVLVPEIALTPQTVARFRSHFGDRIAVLHSALSDGERYDAWHALHEGEKRIAIGARSAIFAPIARLGAIVVDEEHESTYKQNEAPRYHARELAVVRARLARAVCVLGSATPSLESWHNAQRGKFRALTLPERVEGRPLPPVRIVDLRTGKAEADRGAQGVETRLSCSLSEPLVT